MKYETPKILEIPIQHNKILEISKWANNTEIRIKHFNKQGTIIRCEFVNITNENKKKIQEFIK